MDNSHIACCFSLLAKLTEIHGGNNFKAASYASTAFAVEKLPLQLKDLPHEKIVDIKGIGDSSSKKIIELLTTGSLNMLDKIIESTPKGVMELMNIKGIGPKKLAVIWKQMEIETAGELLYACKENRLKLYKGFGEKTQHTITETIEFYLKSKGSYLFSQTELIAEEVKTFFEKTFFPAEILLAGDYKRQLEIIHELQLVVDGTTKIIEEILLTAMDFILIERNQHNLLYSTVAGLKIRVYGCDDEPFMQQVFFKNCSNEFAEAFKHQNYFINYAACKNEEDVFIKAGLHYIPACQRETAGIIETAKLLPLPPLLQVADIKGIIHSHSNWSDGNNTIEQMAKAAVAKGFEYLIISDHSKTAVYADGLHENRIKEQHIYIDELNKALAPFRILKSIESDILNDGSLDYSNAILSTFDMVIASVHSNLKMNEDKAMMRLVNAIENPYTTILGHMTGRLLLSRKGYPLDYKKIIDACAANNVVIELNANPSRLDMDWRHIAYALEKNVLISVNPDAHSIKGFDDIRYGVLVAQKAMVSKENNLSSFSLQQLETFLWKKKDERRITV